MTIKPDIAILSFSNIQRDGRVLRQIEYLSRHYMVSIIGYGQLPPILAERASMCPVLPTASRIRRLRKLFWLPLARLTSPRFYETWYWNDPEFKQAYKILCQLCPAAIHANDWESLPVAIRAAQETGALVIADLHEYAPLIRENRPYWRLFYKPLNEYFLRQCLPYVHASVTVNQTIADRYNAEYHINPIVVMNAPQITDAPIFRPTQPNAIALVHHGNAIRDRKLELMIETLALLDKRYTLHLMLVERNPGYIQDLKALADKLVPNRVYFHAPVQPSEIVTYISQFDIGFYLVPAHSYNQLVASPNKFFDFVVAGLAVLTGPAPEMARMSLEYGFGKVAPSIEPAAAAQILNNLSAIDIDTMKQAAINARNYLNADIELSKLIQLYHSFSA